MQEDCVVHSHTDGVVCEVCKLGFEGLKVCEPLHIRHVRGLQGDLNRGIQVDCKRRHELGAAIWVARIPQSGEHARAD